jgi:hypothetical protein
MLLPILAIEYVYIVSGRKHKIIQRHSLLTESNLTAIKDVIEYELSTADMNNVDIDSQNVILPDEYYLNLLVVRQSIVSV